MPAGAKHRAILNRPSTRGPLPLAQDARAAGALLVASVLVLAGCAGDDPGPAFRTTPFRRTPAAGEMLLTASGTALGRDRAAADQAERRAVRDAVKQALARIVEADLTPEHRRIVRERILGRAAEFVKGHAKIGKPKVAAAATTVTVEAVVSAERLRNALAAIRRVLRPGRLPRLAVVIGPRGKTGAADGNVDLAQGAVEAACVACGFRLVDLAASAVGGEIYSAHITNRAEAVAGFARARGAEVVIAGTAARTFDRETRVDGGARRLYRPTVSLRAMETGSARPLFSGDRTGAAGEGAEDLSLAATALAEECAEAVLKAWRAEARGLNTVLVRIRGIDLRGYARLKRMAEEMHGVATVRGRGFGEGRVEIEVEHSRDPLDLAGAFTTLPGVALEVVSAGVGTVELKVKE